MAAVEYNASYLYCWVIFYGNRERASSQNKYKAAVITGFSVKV
jgi:hypothetical protein